MKYELHYKVYQKEYTAWGDKVSDMLGVAMYMIDSGEGWPLHINDAEGNTVLTEHEVYEKANRMLEAMYEMLDGGKREDFTPETDTE